MQHKRLHRKFFARNTHTVARALLGKLIVRKHRNAIFLARICEVESYVGENDLACHARRGRTPRTEIMYGPAGHAYVYLVYGMHNMLNIVTEKEHFPAAVLIRSARPVAGLPAHRRQGPWRRATEILVKAGPGKLTRALHIDRSLNGEDLTTSKQLYLADDGFRVRKNDILTSPRIGVDFAGAHALLPWRYFIQNV